MCEGGVGGGLYLMLAYHIKIDWVEIHHNIDLFIYRIYIYYIYVCIV